MSVGPGGFNRAPNGALNSTNPRLAPLPRDHPTPRSPTATGYDAPAKHMRSSMTFHNPMKQAPPAHDLARHPSLTMRYHPHPPLAAEASGSHGRSGEQSELGATALGDAMEVPPLAMERQGSQPLSLPVIAPLAQAPPSKSAKAPPGIESGTGSAHHTYSIAQRNTRTQARSTSSLES